MNAKPFYSLWILLLLSLSLFALVTPFHVTASASTLASTELINYGSMTTGEINTFVGLLETQNITLFICRLNSFGEWQSETSTYISKTKQIITIANAHNIEVAVDLHTWYTTWDNYFDSSASNYATHRANYIDYVENVLTAFLDTNVYAFMVMNEPQAQSASSSENNFILSVISSAKAITDKPVSVRFMGGYSPSTGHYASSIDTATDFICRNTYWDARYPSQSKYGCSEQDLLDARDVASGQGKEFWITEFGRSKTNQEEQRDYVEHFVDWANTNSIDNIFCWVSQPDQLGETYNLFSGYSPLPAFYELVNDPLPSDSYPTYSLRGYNTTIAGDPCRFSCNWTDDNGMSGSYFSSNNTGTWANSTWIDLSGTTWANVTVTLNATGNMVVQYEWYANDSANQWTTTTILALTTQTINNVPTYSNIGVTTVIAGQTCNFSVTWSDVEGLSGFIYGTNNTGTWHNETWQDIGVGDPLTAVATVSKTLNTTIGTVIEWRQWDNDTDDNWGDTGGLFLTVKTPDYYFFQDETSYTENVYLAENGLPYLQTSEGIISDLTYYSNIQQLAFTVNGTGTTITYVYTMGKGSPNRVSGATYSYDGATDVLSLTVQHASLGTVVVDWGAAGHGGLLFPSGSSIGFQLDSNQTVLVTVLSGNLSSARWSFLIRPYQDGYFCFVADNDTTIQVDTVNVASLAAQGDQNNTWHTIPSGGSLTISKGNNVCIKWSGGIADTLSWLIMPMLGMFGFFSVGFGSFFVGNKIRQGDPFESVRGCLVAMIFILIGVGLIIGWLW